MLFYFMIVFRFVLRWINAASPDHVMREKIDGVDEAISGDLVTSVSSKNSQREWTFLLKTPRKLMAVALLQDAHRNHFSLRYKWYSFIYLT